MTSKRRISADGTLPALPPLEMKDLDLRPVKVRRTEDGDHEVIYALEEIES